MRETSIDIGRILSLSGLTEQGSARADAPGRRPESKPPLRRRNTAISAPLSGDVQDTPGVRWNAPGFGPLTRIMTSFGAVHAQALRKGDMVRTRSGEFARIEWIDRILIDEDFMEKNPDARPVLIQAGALGRGLPTHDVLLSPGQIISPNEVGMIRKPVRARDLLGRPGFVRKAETATTYTRFHMGCDADVLCEKLWISVNPE